MNKVRNRIFSYIGKYFLASSSIGGTYGYLINYKELGNEPIILVPTIITAGFAPFYPLFYAYEKLCNKKFDFILNK